MFPNSTRHDCGGETESKPHTICLKQALAWAKTTTKHPVICRELKWDARSRHNYVGVVTGDLDTWHRLKVGLPKVHLLNGEAWTVLDRLPEVVRQLHHARDSCNSHHMCQD
jgi:hypothetical protein